jgi:aminoglycoside 6'-N-acetyltransferase
MAIDGSLTWRPLAAADLPLLASWLAEPGVRRWWNHDPAAVAEDFGPSVRGEEPGEDLVVELDGTPVAFVQRARFADYPEDTEELALITEVPDGAVEVDYLIGDPALRGRGLGSRIVDAVVADVLATRPEVPCVIVPVAAGNPASWRALEKAGFTRVAEGPLTPDNPVDPPDHVVYRRDR